MYRNALLAVTCGLALCLISCGKRPIAQNSAEPQGQIIVLTDSLLASGGSDTVRFGHLHSGEIAVLKLALENRTAHPVVPIGYSRNCGCTTLEFDSQPIPPQGNRPLNITFDSRGEQGWQLKIVTLTLSGTTRPWKIVVEADVE